MADPLSRDVFPKVLVNYAPMASVYEALGQVLPPELLDPDARTYVDRLARDAINDGVRRMAAMVEDLTRRELLPAFRNALARLEPTNGVLREVLGARVSVDSEGRVSEAALHTIRGRLEHFLEPKALEALLQTRPRVCAMLVDGVIKGTGFLVGPDLVMTARHVLECLLASDPTDDSVDEQLADSGRRLACVFDYEGTLYRPFPVNPPPPGARVEPVADRWLVWSSHKHYKDGVGHQFNAPPDIKKLFDCAIIRLARSVGAAASDQSGSRIRGWISFNQAGGQLTQGQRLAIWQHPAEGPLVYGDGYFWQQAAGGTRIWYSAPADGGSSGAPCFDTQCRVVAFHNAGWPQQPEPGILTKEYNQGVAIAPLLKALPAQVRSEIEGQTPKSLLLWSLGDDGRDAQGNAHPVLGRERLCRWIEAMRGQEAARRVIIVEESAQDRRAGIKTGKSFSARILRAMMRTRPGMVMTFSAPALEGTEPDVFLTDLAKQAGILADELPIPARPSEERQLTRWWANDLPNWFGLLVEEEARRNGVLKPAPECSEDFDSEVVFSPIWIAIDDIHRAELSPGMRECLAGMIGITETTERVTPGLASLRWLLIGAIPDFVREKAIHYEHDKLAPADIAETAWLACCKSAFAAEGMADRYDEPEARMLYGYAKGYNPVLETVPRTKVLDPAYLPTLAQAAALATAGMLRKAKGV